MAARRKIQYDEERVLIHANRMKRLIECVPNFSEGRDIAKVDAIVAAMRAVDGVHLLDRESDADHNRSVITLAGEPEPVAEAAEAAPEPPPPPADASAEPTEGAD